MPCILPGDSHPIDPKQVRYASPWISLFATFTEDKIDQKIGNKDITEIIQVLWKITTADHLKETYGDNDIKCKTERIMTVKAVLQPGNDQTENKHKEYAAE